MPIVFSAITPHPPLGIPSIGKENAVHLKKTLEAFQKIEQDLYASKPDTVIIISPHGKTLQDSVNINLYPEYEGTFEEFGDFSTKLAFKSDSSSIQEIRTEYEVHEKKLIVLTSNPKIDYGISIPLYFLMQHMKHVPIIPITPCGMDLKTHHKVGRHLKRVLSKTDKRFAIIASGEFSHRLTKDAPGGFSERAEEFDKSIINLIKKHDTRSILHFDTNLSEEASECCLKVISIALGLMMGIKYSVKILSYEFPYGVGYFSAEMLQ